nr:MAG TPA: hypothetical protein [Caudoviricetes sp.]
MNFNIGNWIDEHFIAPVDDFARKHFDGIWWFNVIAPTISIIISLMLIIVSVRRLG